MGGVKSEVGGVRGEDKGIKDVHERENKKVSISTVLCPARAHRRRRKHTTHTHTERERETHCGLLRTWKKLRNVQMEMMTVWGSAES